MEMPRANLCASPLAIVHRHMGSHCYEWECGVVVLKYFFPIIDWLAANKEYTLFHSTHRRSITNTPEPTLCFNCLS